MEIDNLKVMRIGDVRTGTSKATGNEWSVQDLILSWQDERGETNFIRVTGESILCYGLEVGDTISANLNFRTRVLSSGLVVNDIKVINLKK